MAGDVLILDGPTLSLTRSMLLEAAERDAQNVADALLSLGDMSEPQSQDDRRRLNARIDDAQTSFKLLGESMAAVEQVGWPDSDTDRT